LGDANHDVSSDSENFEITQATLTITAKTNSKERGETLTFTGAEFTPAGLLNSDTVTSVTLSSDGAVSTAASGSYSILASNAVGTGLGNYLIGYTSGTLTVVDTIDPSLTAKFAADGVSMPEAPAGTFTLLTHNVEATHRMVQFDAGTSASETLKSEMFGLYLKSSSVSTSDLTAYYNNRAELNGVPTFRAYLIAALDGATHPFAYIDGSTVKLADAAKYDLMGGVKSDMDIPDNYPLGTYVVEGKIKDLAGNEQTVTYTLKVTGDRVSPVLTVAGFTDNDAIMPGTLVGGYTLLTHNVAANNHEIEFKTVSNSDELLKNEAFGLFGSSGSEYSSIDCLL
jgi:hypothetical protein